MVAIQTTIVGYTVIEGVCGVIQESLESAAMSKSNVVNIAIVVFGNVPVIVDVK